MAKQERKRLVKTSFQFTHRYPYGFGGRRALRCGLRLAVAFVVLCLCACGSQPVAQDLSQQQANEIVATLSSLGIKAEASRETGGNGRYRVEVKPGAYSQAVSILHRRNLPSDERPSFQDLIAQRGVIPNSRGIDALRLDRAVATEIEDALEDLPALVSARVLVRRPIAIGSTASPAATTAGVAAVLVQRKGAQVDMNEVRQIISRVVPDIPSDQIYIVAHDALPAAGPGNSVGVLSTGEETSIAVPLTAFLWLWRVPDDDYTSLALVLVSMLISVLVLGVLVGMALGRYWNAGRRGAVNRTAGFSSRGDHKT